MDRWVDAGLLSVVLIAAAVCDWRTGKVPNVLTYPAVLVGFLWWGLSGWIAVWPAGSGLAAGLASASVGFVAGLIPFAIIFAAGGLGGGDVKLMAAVGALSASWPCVLSTTVYAFVIGAVMAVIVMIRRGLVRRVLGRLLGAALLGARGAGGGSVDEAHRVPFAVAIAVGGLLAVAETMCGLSTPWAPMMP
ncbi:MAG: hypothetical protein CMJ49_06880 [Planctomycetaceae bacterium]|nr:hypothetical protein [Planctomycetaceae bacterium]